MAEKTYRIRDIGYDAKDHSADWYNCVDSVKQEG